MGNWSDVIQIGAKGILLRKLRTLLSTLGIVFGVAAVISMMAVGEGARREAIEQIKLLGTNNIRIKHLQLTGERRAKAERSFSRGLTYHDTIAIAESIAGSLGVVPLRFVEAEVRVAGRPGLAQVIGTTPEHQDVTSFRPLEGRFLTALDVADTKNVCVLGAEVKDELFGYNDALGAPVRIGDVWFTVVGVMESKAIREGRAAVIKVRNINRDVYIPVTTALRRFPPADDPARVDELALRVAHADQLAPVARVVRAILARTHRDVEDYELIIPEELLAQAQRTQRIFNIVMGSVAAISLLVGGIGIMNIMLANVSERTREIGIRRAIGATKAHIVAQFLTEAVLICAAGGMLGILVGFGLARAITLYAKWETGLSLVSVLIAFGTAATVGILFGLVPARRAAQLDPVRALREVI